MATGLQRTQIGIKRTEEDQANVPNNSIAKIMYYMNCICRLIDIDDCIDDRPNIKRLINYQHHEELNAGEQIALVLLCGTVLTPDVFIDKCMFQDDDMCGNRRNVFYELEAVRTNLGVSNNIIIGQQRRQVHKIMTYKASWLKEYWTDPMGELLEGCKQVKRRVDELARLREQRSYRSSNSSSSGCCCTIL